MDPRRLRVFLLLAGLYVSQGLPFGFFTQALPVILRQSGASLGAIGLSNLLALPWALKFLWAPLFDLPRWRGPTGRLGLVAGLQAISVGVLGLTALADPSAAITPVLVAVFLANLVAATQDIATDALAVEALPPTDRGWGNGVQVGGYRIGMILGGGALLSVLAAHGWTIALGALAGALVLASLPLLSAPPLPDRPAAPRASADGAGLGPWLARPAAARWLLLLLFYKTGDAFGTAVVKPMLVDFGLGLAEIGWLFGVVGSGAALAGAAVASGLIGRLGLRGALAGFALLQAATIGLWAVVALHPSAPLWTAAVACEHFCSAMATTALFTAMMAACRPERSAGDYTVQASTVVVAQGLAAVVGGFSADALGYGGHLGLAFLLAGLVVPAAWRVSAAVWPAAAHQD